MKNIVIYLLYKILEVMEGDVEMVDFFFYRVIDGHRTCNPENNELPLVPKRFIQSVSEMLEKEGLDLDGKPIIK